MSWCCTHPGAWTQRLGRDVLKAEDKDFVEDWEDIFRGSQLVEAEQAVSGGEADVLNPDLHCIDSAGRLGRERVRPSALETDDKAELGTWIRAATPFATPIGVVQ